MSVLRKITKGVQTGVSIAQKGAQVGHSLGLFEADAPAASAEPVSDVELQSFMSVLRKIAKGVQTGVSVAQKGAQVGHSLGLFEADAPAASAEPVSDVELQSFMSVLRKITKGVQTGVSIAQKGAQVGHSLGLFEADAPAASAEPVSDIELQSFMSVLRRIVKGATKVAGVVQKGAEAAHDVGLLQSEPQARAAEVSEAEMQSLLGLLRKIAESAGAVH